MGLAGIKTAMNLHMKRKMYNTLYSTSVGAYRKISPLKLLNKGYLGGRISRCAPTEANITLLLLIILVVLLKQKN